MKYYFGGYYLIKPRKIEFGSKKGKEYLTCSSCINDSLYDSWTLSWTTPIEEQIKELRNELQIDEQKQEEIQKWADEKFENGKMGWLEVFSDLETLREYSHKFFRHIKNKVILKILFPENEMEDYLREFKPKKDKEGKSGIYENLTKRMEYTNSNDNEVFIGYDLIGAETGGAGFHTFHCHDLTNDLKREFGIELNEYGLIEKIRNQKEIVDYMNDEENGFEPVPWFLIKVMKVKNAST